MGLIEKTFQKEEARLFCSNRSESQESANFCPEVFLTPDQYQEAVENKTLLTLDQLCELFAKVHRNPRGWQLSRRPVYQDLIPKIRG